MGRVSLEFRIPTNVVPMHPFSLYNRLGLFLTFKKTFKISELYFVKFSFINVCNILILKKVTAPIQKFSLYHVHLGLICCLYFNRVKINNFNAFALPTLCQICSLKENKDTKLYEHQSTHYITRTFSKIVNTLFNEILLYTRWLRLSRWKGSLRLLWTSQSLMASATCKYNSVTEIT